MNRPFLARVCLLAVVFWVNCTRVPEPPVIHTDTLDESSRQAVQRLRQEVVNRPSSADTWGGLGQLLDALQFSHEAEICYARAAELDPHSARWRHLLALQQLPHDLDTAISNLTRAADLAPTNDISRLRLVQALIERGRLGEATNELQKLLQRQPNHPAARLELGRALFVQGQTADMERVLSPSLTNAFTARQGLLVLSQAEARAGRVERAGALAERAAGLPRPFDWPDPFLREVQALRPQRAELADKASSLLARGRIAEAEQAIEELRVRFPQEPESLLLFGRLRLQQQKYGEAEAAFRQYLERNSESVNGLFQLSLALLRQQRWPAAATVLQRVIAGKPDFAQAHANLALARSRAGDTTGAIRSYRDALRCRPGDAPTHLALAEELARTGARKEAHDEIDLALQIDPKSERALKLRALIPKP